MYLLTQCSKIILMAFQYLFVYLDAILHSNSAKGCTLHVPSKHVGKPLPKRVLSAQKVQNAALRHLIDGPHLNVDQYRPFLATLGLYRAQTLKLLQIICDLNTSHFLN